MNGLEALKRIRQETAPNTYCKDFDKEECCNTIEKELKALEIIKEKRINVVWFSIVLHDLKYCDIEKQIKTYNSKVAKWNVIDQDEFDLLKEVMK